MAGASGFKVERAGVAPRPVVQRRKPGHPRSCGSTSAGASPAGSPRTYRLTFDLKDPGGAATRDLRVGDSLVSFPVWAYATRSTPGSTVTVVFPAGFDVEVEAGEIPAPDHRGRRPDDLPERAGSQAPLEFFAYLVADRPGAYTGRHGQRRTVLRAPGLGPRPGLAGRRALGEARQRPGRRRLPALGDRIGAAWPRLRRAAGRPGGGESVDRWLRRAVRPERRAGRDRLLRRRLRRAPRSRPRLVQRLAAGRPLGQRGVRVVLRERCRRRHQAQGPTSTS